MPLLRPLVVCIVLSLYATGTIAQGSHRFLYLQTEDGQPFFVKAGEVYHSSSISGFLILSKLQDTAIEMVLGFPRDMYPAQSFRVSHLDRDRGLVVKRREDGQWMLVDLHTMEITPGRETVKDAPNRRQPINPATSDSFTTVLSSVISDSTLLDTKVAPGRDEGKPVTPATPSPPDNLVSKLDSLKTLQTRETNVPDVPVVAAASVKETDSRSIGSIGKGAATATPLERGQFQTGSSVVRPDRSDCGPVQSAKQLGDLRRRMESIRDEEAKVVEATKEMRLRCFTTEQLRSLLVVFDREEGRYKMLSAGYPLVQDPSNYPDILPVLKDPYFIHRFKRLTGMPLE